MTKDPVLAHSIVQGRAPEPQRLGVACVPLNQTVHHVPPSDAMMAPGALSETAATIRKDAVATIKLTGYSVNSCFYRESPVAEGDAWRSLLQGPVSNSRGELSIEQVRAGLTGKSIARVHGVFTPRMQYTSSFERAADYFVKFFEM
jgi:hypothetical protein